MYFPIEHLNMEESRIRTFFEPSKSSNMNNFPMKSSNDRSPIQLPDLKSLNINDCLERCSPTPSNYSMFDDQRNGRDTESIQVKVPTSEHVAEIVGKQGCKIKSLRYTTKTYIQTPARDQEPVFTISGYPEDVERARLRIEEAANHFTQIRQRRDSNNPITPQLAANAIVRYVRVPLRYVGLVVGPKGHNIKRIQSETDTFIMTPARDKEPVFEIRGTPDKVAEAENKLQLYIAMRTGGHYDDADHIIDVDLKKPMLPPQQAEGFMPLQSFGTAARTPTGWGESLYSKTSDPLSFNTDSAFSPDNSRADADSGYSSPPTPLPEPRNYSDIYNAAEMYNTLLSGMAQGMTTGHNQHSNQQQQQRSHGNQFSSGNQGQYSMGNMERSSQNRWSLF